MSANDPRLEFRPGPATRARLEKLRRGLEQELGRKVSMSELVKEIIEDYFVRADRAR